MSTKIDAKEVLRYLNELGYTNITAHQLKDFITDLKKLMKYEEKMSQTSLKERTTEHPNSEVSDYTRNTSLRGGKENLYEFDGEKYDKNDICERDINTQKHDIFNYLHSRETVSSEAKKSKSKQSVISVSIRKPSASHTCVTHDHCVHDQVFVENTLSNLRSKSDGDVLKSSIGDSSGFTGTKSSLTDYRNPTEIVRPLLRSKSKTAVSLRPKTSFIRPTIARSYKTDPVALYKQYQEEWKRNKIPGEDNRSDLRWAIREKMLGGPSVNFRRI